MEKETCRNCKFSCKWCISEKNPHIYCFYCIVLEDIYDDDKKCSYYQKDSRNVE